MAANRKQNLLGASVVSVAVVGSVVGCIAIFGPAPSRQTSKPAPTETAASDDEFTLGAHTAMGPDFDMTRDGLFLMARSAGNAAHCKIITNAQADAIVSQATTSRLTLKGDEFLQMEAAISEWQQKGFQDNDCSTWASPRAVAIEKNLAVSSGFK